MKLAYPQFAAVMHKHEPICVVDQMTSVVLVHAD